jgi:hypothetical protein
MWIALLNILKILKDWYVLLVGIRVIYVVCMEKINVLNVQVSCFFIIINAMISVRCLFLKILVIIFALNVMLLVKIVKDLMIMNV